MWSEADSVGVAKRRFGRRARGPTPVEVTGPDSASALLDDAATHFRIELIEDRPGVIVRLRPALFAPAGWVFEFLAIVERWLDAHDVQSRTCIMDTGAT